MSGRAPDTGGEAGGTVPDIASYAMIGDCHTAALVSRDGAIDWCCLPRFDSATTFGRLLEPRGGACTVEVDGAAPEPCAREYLHGTLVLVTTLRAAGGQARLYDCFAIDPEARRGDDGRLLLRIVEGVRGAVPLRIRIAPRFDYGEVEPLIHHHGEGLYSAVGGDDGLLCWSDAGLEVAGEYGLEARATVRAGGRLRLALQYRRPETLDNVGLEPPPGGDGAGPPPFDAAGVDGRLEATIAWWRDWAGLGDSPDAGARRSALVLKGLTYAPTGAMVAAATTSLPETPDGERRWDYRYSWIRDAVLATRSLAELGHAAEADALRRFMERSAAGRAEDLRIFYGVGGERRTPEMEVGPVRVGNAAGDQLQLDALGFLVEQSWRWFQRGHAPDDDYWRFVVALVDAAAEHWREPDCGIWEWRGEPRHFVHSKAQCWAALDRGLKLAEQCMRKAPERRWRAARDEVRDAIEAEGYDRERNTFVQAFGHDALDAALLRLPAIGFVDYDDPRMVGTVDAVREALGDGGLLRRYHVDDELPGREGAFLACSFWLAECLARQGRPEEARDAFDRAVATGNDLGLFAEEFDTEGSRMLGNFPQALTHLSHIEAALALAAAQPSKALAS